MKRYPIRRIFRILCLRIACRIPMSGRLRARFVKWGGVNIKNPKKTYIGENVVFDSLHPELITIGERVHITLSTVIYTHHLDTTKLDDFWKKGEVKIGDGTFIGAHTIICNSVVIGKNVIVGAGSVVTKSIPDNEIWGGNPARFIKNREIGK